MDRRLWVAGIVSLALAAPARAQFGDLLDSAKRQAEEAARKAADDAASGKPEAAPPARGEEPKEERGPARSSQPSSAAAPAAAEPAAGEVYGNRFDFVPGEKVIVFDDFSDTAPGDYPRRWTLGDGGNPVEVVEIQGRRWLMSIADEGGEEMREAHSYIRTNLEKELPEKFTVELDVPATFEGCVVFPETYWTTGSDSVCFGPTSATMPWGSMTNDNVAKPVKPIRHVSIAISGTNVKVYFDGQRVLQNPDGVRVRHKVTTIGISFKGGEKRKDLRLTSFRLAAGGKDYAKELVSGRIVTHGITFDTGSDAIKPESGPTLRSILQLMQDDAALRFEVQGHTDDQGGAKVNGPLSERRAAAVRTWLVKQGIDGSRLRSKGLGDTKPIDSNGTSEGRANNRRVEFVKLTGTS